MKEQNSKKLIKIAHKLAQHEVEKGKNGFLWPCFSFLHQPKRPKMPVMDETDSNK